MPQETPMYLYNTLTHKKEPFVPKTPGHVSMYACGITAYDLCHIGHARSAVVFDVLARYLRHKGYALTFVRNFTDIDDKILARAKQEGTDYLAVSRKYIDAFHADMDRLGIQRPDKEPKATESIPEMIALCEKLIEKGHAYATEQGDVYFRVRTFADYGKLSGRSVDDLRAGARIAIDEKKEDPLDFALWKAAKPGEPFWESPWGKGRPGWHIECSAMSKQHLPLPIDIHGGGQDLVFPHHENEIAQSEAAFGGELAKYWVHNGFVQIDSEKMSKSLGNFQTIRDILADWHPEVLRFFLLGKHYRSPIDFTLANMEDAEKGLKRLYEAFRTAEKMARPAAAGAGHAVLPDEIEKEVDALERAWLAAMDDDLNTAAAIGHIFGIARLINRIADDRALRRAADAPALFQRLLGMRAKWAEVLGIGGENAEEFLHALRETRVKRKNISVPAIERLLEERAAARQAKDFARADGLRRQLADMGIAIQDTPGSVEWDIA